MRIANKKLSAGLIQLPQVLTPEDLEGMLLWKDPVQSGKVFAGGLYGLICVRQLVNGTHFLHMQAYTEEIS